MTGERLGVRVRDVLLPLVRRPRVADGTDLELARWRPSALRSFRRAGSSLSEGRGAGAEPLRVDLRLNGSPVRSRTWQTVQVPTCRGARTCGAVASAA